MTMPFGDGRRRPLGPKRTAVAVAIATATAVSSGVISNLMVHGTRGVSSGGGNTIATMLPLVLLLAVGVPLLVFTVMRLTRRDDDDDHERTDDGDAQPSGEDDGQSRIRVIVILALAMAGVGAAFYMAAMHMRA